MATPSQLTQIAFAGGLDEGQEDEILDPSKSFLVLQNGRQNHRGGYSKRLGYGSLSLARMDATPGVTRSTGNRLICHNEVTCTIDGTYLDAFAETPNYSIIASRVPEASITTRTLVTNGDILHDIVQCNGFIASAVHRDGAIYVGLETTDGVVVRTPEVVHTTGAVTLPRGLLGNYSTYIILLATHSGSANVVAYYLNTASVATLAVGWQSIGNVATDRSTALSSQSLTDRVAFAYANSGGGTSRLTVKTITIAGVVDSTTVNTSSVRPDVVAVEGSLADTLWASWNESTTVKMKGLTANSLSTVLASTASMITGYFQANNAPPHIVSGSTAGTGKIAITSADGTMFVEFASSMGVLIATTTPTLVCGIIMDARPFRIGSRYYGLFRPMDVQGSPSMSGVSTPYGVSVMGDWTDATTAVRAWIRPVGVAFQNLTSSIASRTLHPIVGTTTASYAVPVIKSAQACSSELITYNFADRKRWRSASHNGSLFLSGGILSYFDGSRVAEAAFLHSPCKPVATDLGTGTGPTGPVVYVATFEEIDADGNWAISGVSLPSAPLTITNHTATVSVMPLALSARLRATADPRTRVSFYRTTQSGVAPYYFVGDVINDTSNAYNTFVDGLTDAAITSNRKLYGTGELPGTNGAAQDRRAPPFCQDVISYNGMLVVASGSNLCWSGQTVDGEHAWFSPAFVSPVEGDDNIVSLAVQDGTIYIFKARRIYTVTGEPPSDNGSAGGLGTPRLLPSDVGCIDPCSVVVTSLGIFFQSRRGIELLTRSGTVVWIGEAVQRTLASYPIVSTAVLDDPAGLVRFSLATSESGGRVSGAGRDLVYDITLQCWISVDDKTGATSHEASQDAAVIKTSGVWRYAWIGTDGTVRYERSTSDMLAYYDGGTWITMAAETAWFKVSGVQGKQFLNHVLFLARSRTTCQLSVSLAYNYETSFRTARQWTGTEIAALLTAGWPITQLKHEPHNDAECQSMRVRIEDALSSGGTGNGVGATWLALTLDITPKGGIFDVPEAAA